MLHIMYLCILLKIMLYLCLYGLSLRSIFSAITSWSYCFPNIEQTIGYALGGAIALYLQKMDS